MRNVVVPDALYGQLHVLGGALINPLVVLLAALAAVSYATGDARAGARSVLLQRLQQDNTGGSRRLPDALQGGGGSNRRDMA